MCRRSIHVTAALLLSVLLTAPAFGQATSGPGAGRDVNTPTPPGLEQQTPRPLTEQDLQLYIPDEQKVIGRVSIPDQKLATLVQPEGRQWRAYRMDMLFWLGAVIILGMLAGLAVFHFWHGPMRLERGRSGRPVPRFGFFDRFAHWTTALAFITLALTGLIITFGRYVLIPILGHDAFTVLADGSKYLHNFASVPFALGLLAMIVLWIRDNIPTRADLMWLRHAGGLLRGQSFHPETGRFNAGQKALFWFIVVGGLAMIVSGALLLVPFSYFGVGGMQVTHVLHSALAQLMIAAILGHIYIGTLGMEGAFDAMGRGSVDENWAIEHHKGWYEQLRRTGRSAPSGRAGAAD